MYKSYVNSSQAEAIAPTAAKVTRTKALAPSHQLEAVLAEEQRLNPRLGNDRKKRVKAEKKQTRCVTIPNFFWLAYAQ
jgi:hypothetical protein